MDLEDRLTAAVAQMGRASAFRTPNGVGECARMAKDEAHDLHGTVGIRSVRHIAIACATGRLKRVPSLDGQRNPMPTYEIEHKWANAQTNVEVEKVQSAIAMAKNGTVPAGFRPIAIVAVPGQPEAHCLWEAPSAEGLETIYRSLNLPTTRSIREVTPFFSG